MRLRSLALAVGIMVMISALPVHPGKGYTAANTDTFDSTAQNNQRKLVRTADGVLHMVYERNGRLYYVNSSSNGTAWGIPKDISGSWGTAGNPALATNGTALYVVYILNDTVAVRKSLNGGGSWIPPVDSPPEILGRADPSGFPAAAASGSHVYAAWRVLHSGRWVINASNATGTGPFSTPVTVSPEGNSSRPSMCMDQTNVYLVWQQGPGQREIMFNRSPIGGGWLSAPLDVSSTPGDSSNPSLACRSGSLYLVWQEMSGSNPEIVMKYSTDGGSSWSSNPSSVSSNPSASRFPSVSIASNGDVYVIWQDNERHTTNDTFLRRYNSTSSSWDQKIMLTDSTLGSRYPSMAELGYGDVVEWIYTHGTGGQYSVEYDYYYTGENSRPRLEWTGEANYENAGLYPETGGTTAHTYVYMVMYVDADGDLPQGGAPYVWIDRNGDGDFDDDSERVRMFQADSGDQDVTDGKVYYYTTKFPAVGQDYSYRFFARDRHHAIADGPATEVRNYPDISIVDHEPGLRWTGELGYSMDGVEPENGTTATVFTFRVEYFDVDGDAPYAGYPQVWIDLNLNGVYGMDERFTMQEVDPEDTNYIDGKMYTYSTTLPSVGVYTYRFTARDAYNISDTGETGPAKDTAGPEVLTENTPPELRWAGVGGYTSDGVEPDSGSTSLIYQFRVVYADAEGDVPAEGMPQVWIDMDLSGTFEDSESFQMVSADQGNITSGRTYVYNASFSEVGTYMYRFYAEDVRGGVALGEPISVKEGPDIVKKNHDPVISAVDGGAAPGSGKNTTKFTFTANYTDSDNDAPEEGYPRLWIDLNANGSFEEGEHFPMFEVDTGDRDYTDGKLYSITMVVKTPGTHMYRFEAVDVFGGQAWSRKYSGPDVDSHNNPPVLEWVGTSGYERDGVEPDSGTSKSTFSFRVLFRDVDNDMPEEGYPQLWIDLDRNGDYNGSNERQVMEEADPSDTVTWDGKVYIFNTTMATPLVNVGSYTYRFVAFDSEGAEAQGAPANDTEGPVITSGNRAPSLSWVGTEGYVDSGVSPHAGNNTTVFTFRVVYTDPDGDMPLKGTPRVYIDSDVIGRSMEEEDRNDTDTADGKVYVYSMTFSEFGTHTYRFSASDRYGLSADGEPTLEHSGPTVFFNHPSNISFYEGFPEGRDVKSPAPGDSVRFCVVYTDPDGEEPALSLLHIDLNHDGDYDDPNEQMVLRVDHGNITDGALYCTVAVLPGGETAYWFEFVDPEGAAYRTDELKVSVGEKPVDSTPTLLVAVAGAISAAALGVVGYLLGRRSRPAPSPAVPGVTPLENPPYYRQ